MVPGTYGFQLRMLLGGGVPEEQFDDGPTVKYTVSKVEEPPPPPPPPPKKPFPWWIVAVIVAVIAIVVIGGIIAFVVSRPPATGTIVVITSVTNDDGQTASPGDFSQHILVGGTSQADFAGAAFPGVSRTVNAGQYQVTEDARVFTARRSRPTVPANSPPVRRRPARYSTTTSTSSSSLRISRFRSTSSLSSTSDEAKASAPRHAGCRSRDQLLVDFPLAQVNIWEYRGVSAIVTR